MAEVAQRGFRQRWSGEDWQQFWAAEKRLREADEALSKWCDANGVPRDSSPYEQFLAGKVPWTDKVERMHREYDTAFHEFQQARRAVLT